MHKIFDDTCFLIKLTLAKFNKVIFASFQLPFLIEISLSDINSNMIYTESRSQLEMNFVQTAAGLASEGKT